MSANAPSPPVPAAPKKRRPLVRALKLLPIVLGVVFLGLGARTYLAEKRFDEAHPPPGTLVDVGGGIKIHARDARVPEAVQDAVPVLMIHGNPGTAADFGRVQHALRQERRTVAVDRPGHGFSGRAAPIMTPAEQAKLIHAAADRLDLDRPIVLGFSFGGPVALAYAVDYPTDIRALVLVSSIADPAAGRLENPIQTLVATPYVGPFIAWTVGPLAAPGEIRKGLAEAFAPDPVDPAALDLALEQWTRPGPMQASACDWKGLDSSWTALAARYGEIRVPVEVLAAPGDAIVKPAHTELLKQKIAGANVVAAPNHGHFLQYSATDAVLEAVRRAAARAGR
jgi:pimeloyl-ACP methyl ester carboxylesterase